MSANELWNEIGNLYFLSDSYDQAIHAYYKAIQLDVGFGKTYSNLALIFAKQKKYEDAILLYKRSLDLLTDDIEKSVTWNRLGHVYRYLKVYDEAVSAYQRADQLKDDIAENKKHSNHMNYVLSESETLSYEMVETQPDYQNHSADYILDTVEPEFDEELPELVPVDIEILTQENHFDHETLTEQTLSNIAETNSETNVEDEENEENPVVVVPESDPTNTPENIEGDGYTKFSLEVESLVDMDVQKRDKSKLFEIIQTKEALESASDNLWVNLAESDTVHNEELQAVDSDSQMPIAQADEDVEELPVEIAFIDSEAGIQSEEDAQEINSNSPEFNDLVEAEANTEKHIPESVSNSSLEDTTQSEDGQVAERELDVEKKILEKQIEINPRSATTWEALGTLYKTAGRYEDAIQAFEQAISIDPDTVSYFHNLGLVYSALGNTDEAFNTFQKVLKLDPNHSLTHASLGRYYKNNGLDELAQKHIEKAMKHIYETENEYNRACMDAICGNTDRAIELLGVALENKQTYIDWVLHDPDLDSLHEDERFKQLISENSR